MSHYQPETGTYYDPQKDPQFEGKSFQQIVKAGKPRVLGKSWDEALAAEIPLNATFIGNLTWPQNAYDGTNMEHLVDSMRFWGTHAVGPPGTNRYVTENGNERPGLKADQRDYGKNNDQVGIYHVFKDAPALDTL
jgi:hypothetical protein